MWVLGTRSGSSGRPASALNPHCFGWVSSGAPKTFLSPSPSTGVACDCCHTPLCVRAGFTLGALCLQALYQLRDVHLSFILYWFNCCSTGYLGTHCSSHCPPTHGDSCLSHLSTGMMHCSQHYMCVCIYAYFFLWRQQFTI